MSAAIVRLWALLLIVKLVVSAWLPMTPDEAYYWVWSQHLQLSYYDHPAMVAWLMRLGEVFLWLAQAVRWPSVVMGHATLLVWVVILRERMSERQLKLFLGVAALTPLIGVGSIIVTPDVPLVFFWSCALLCLKESLRTGRTRWYVLLGASLGLGFCSKYQIVLFVPILFAWLALENKWHEVKWQKALLTVVVGLLFCFPVLYWNYRNGLVSFRFQLDHGLGKTVWNPNWTLEYLGGQILLIFPTLLFLLCRKAGRDNRSWLFYFAWGPVLFFFFTSFRGAVEANWPIVAYPSLLALAVIAAEKFRYGGHLLKVTMAIWTAVFFLILSNLYYPWFPLSALSARYEVMQEYYELSQIIDKYQPIYAGNYQLASILSFAAKKVIYKPKGYSRRDYFDELAQSIPPDRDFYIIVEKEQLFPQALIDLGYVQVDRFRVDRHHFIVEIRRE